MTDLANVKLLLLDAVEQMDSLKVVPIDGPSAADKAAVSRQLNRLADTLDRAAAETRATYWAARGFPDPLLED